MRRILRLAALPALALCALTFAGTATATAAVTADAVSASCTGTIQIDSFAFSTPVVTAGQEASATLTATNCTSQPVSASVMIYGRFFGPGGSTLPAGCPVGDPMVVPASFAANGQFTYNFVTSTFASCTAASYEEYLSISVGGTTVATATATVAIQGGTGPCHVVYTRSSEWQGGFVASVSIANTSTASFSGWKLSFTFGGDQQITGAWDAGYSQSGETVTLTSTSSDATIAAGATLSGIGFIGTWHASDASPTSFALNGVTCA